MKKLSKLAVVVAGLGGLGLAGPVFATNGYFSHGYGMKSKGMAGVGIALPQDALAAASNPAGMVVVGNRVDVGVDWFRPKRDSTISGSFGGVVDGDYDGSGEKNYLIPEFGYNRMINPDMSVGVSVFGNGGMNTTYDDGIPLFGTSEAGVDLMQLFIAPTFAMRVAQNHHLGVSLNLAYQRFEAKGLQNFTGFSVSPGDVTNRGYDSSTGWGLSLGYLWKVTPSFWLGASYRSKTHMGKFDDYKGLFAESGDFDIPATWGVGVTFMPTQQLTVAVDVQRIEYGDVDAIANKVDCFFAGACALGADNGPGFGWRDMTIYKLGVAYAVNPDLTLRAGYSHGRQPIPSSQTLFNMLAPGVVEDHVTLGGTWKIAPQHELTVAYMHAFKETVKGSNSIPLGGGFPGGEADIRLKEDSLGVAWGMNF